MQKKYIIGGLAIIGALALFAYLKPKPKLNSEGFFGANGRTSKTSSGGCRVCRGISNNYYAVYGQCRQGDSCREKVMSTN